MTYGTYNPSQNSQMKTSDVFGDVSQSAKNQYTGQWLKLSTGKEITDFSKWIQEIPKDINVYWDEARKKESLTPGTLAERNDFIAYNLKAQWVQDKQAISDYLMKQSSFQSASIADQQNTINSIAARMGITKEATTKEDQLNAEQQALFDSYKVEQDKLITEWDKQDFVKRMDHLLWENIRNLTDAEVAQLAAQSGLTPEEWRKVADEWSQARQKVYEPYQYKQEDLTKDKDRAIQDANTQLERTTQSINNSIDDVTTQMQRDVAGAEKVGALKWYVQSSGYMQGIGNIKSDANKLVGRLQTQLANAQTDTAQYISRVWEDFTTNMTRVKTAFTDDLLNLRMAGTNEVNALLWKYSTSDDILTNELERLNNEYGIKSQELYGKFLENFKGITDAAMYEAEKIQQFQTKQKELENLTLWNLYENNGMALRNMTDADIENLYKNGYISADQVNVLKSARAWAIEDYNMNLAYKQSQTALNVSKASNVSTPTGNPATSAQTVADWTVLERWQCVQFVNDILEQNGYAAFSHDADQSLANKISKSNSKTPSVWSVLIRQTNTPDWQKYWDVVIITWVDWNTISFKWSNQNWDNTVYSGTIQTNDPSIKWYYDPNKAPDSYSQLSASQKTQADTIYSSIYGKKSSPKREYQNSIAAQLLWGKTASQIIQDTSGQQKAATDMTADYASAKKWSTWSSIVAIDTTMWHMEEYQKAIAEYNKWWMPALNKLVQQRWYQAWTNAKTVLSQITTALSNELRNVYGWVSEWEVKQWSENIPVWASASQAKAWLDTAHKLISSRLVSMNNKWKDQFWEDYTSLVRLSDKYWFDLWWKTNITNSTTKTNNNLQSLRDNL